MKNKIATVLKITKTKIKQSYELRKFHTSRGENEQLQKTSGAYVLSSRKKNRKCGPLAQPSQSFYACYGPGLRKRVCSEGNSDSLVTTH